ncbi:MAG TPA: DegV family protein [Gaiellaceae bacterium]|nr:DegV family protein [Gaiellaceae bacterium]
MKLTAANTAIVLDSTADFPEGPERFPNWRVVPLYVNFGGTSYRDYVDLGPDELYGRLADAPQSPTTSQPTPGDFLAVYEELAGYERILSLQLSSTLSGTFASAAAAAATAGGAVRVIDTRTVSAAVAMLALAVERRLDRGTTDEEIEALLERFRATHGLLFTVDTLEFLARGGRIGRAAAFAGMLLNVKPILGLEEGEVVPLKRVRGSQKALEELRDLLVAATGETPSLRIGLAHAAAPERVATLERLVREARPRAQVEIVTSLGAVVGTHAGPGTLGLFWFDDE